jgi:nucleoside transporter
MQPSPLSVPGSNRARFIVPKLFIVMMLEFFIWGAWLPLVWTYLGGLGFTGNEIAMVGSTFALAAIAAIFLGAQWVDRTFAAERFMICSHLLGGLAMIGLYFARSFGWFFVLMLLHSLCYVPTVSVANSLAFAHLKDARRQFGWVRMGGTIGWIVASWPLYFVLRGMTGPALQSALGNIFLLAGGVSIALAAFCLTLPHTSPRSTEGEPLAWKGALRHLAAQPYLLALFLVTFIDSTIHNGYFLLTGGFLAKIGVAPENIMPVMSIGQVAEIVTMGALGFFLRRLGWKWTMIVGVLGHAGRFLVFAFCSESIPAVVAVQLLHGICYAFFFATLYIFIDAAFAHDMRTSAQGLFNLLILGLGDLAAKWLFIPLQAWLTHAGVVDYRTLFLVPAGLAFVAVFILLVVFRPPPGLGTAERV